MLRMVRVFKNNDDLIVTKPGGAEKMGLGPDDGTVGEDWSGTGAEGKAGQAVDVEEEMEL